MQFINIADMVNPKTGKTHREENLALSHKIPVGALVEVRGLNGVRLHVVYRARDCDGTPLYSLGILGENAGDLAILKEKTYPPHILEMFNGYGEESLELVRLPE